MDDDVVAACSGTFRPEPPDATPRQRRLQRWSWAVWVVAMLLVVVGSAVVTALLSRAGPRTRVDGAGLSSRSAFRESGSAPWADVVGFRPPGGFREHWAAELRSGGALELPGLPTDVADRLAAALPAAPPASRADRRAHRTPLPDVDGWDGPFHRSPRGR